MSHPLTIFEGHEENIFCIYYALHESVVRIRNEGLGLGGLSDG